MAVTFAELVKKHGEAKAMQIGAVICEMHGGISVMDFKAHRGGIDYSGCSQEDQEAIEHLIAKDAADETDVAEPAKPLTKMTKAELVAEAERLNIDVTPDSMTNKDIIAAIEGNQE
jgi:hypothetical protein